MNFQTRSQKSKVANAYPTPIKTSNPSSIIEPDYIKRINILLFKDIKTTFLRTSPRIRKKMISLMSLIFKYFNLEQETLYIATTIQDQILQSGKASLLFKSHLVLLPVASIYLAQQFHQENNEPNTNDYVLYLSSNEITHDSLLSAVNIIFRQIGYIVRLVSPFDYISELVVGFNIDFDNSLVERFRSQCLLSSLNFELNQYRVIVFTVAVALRLMNDINEIDQNYLCRLKDLLFPLCDPRQVHECLNRIENMEI